MDKERFIYLFSRYANDEHTEVEKQELMELINGGEYEKELHAFVSERWNMDIANILEGQDSKAEETFNLILNRIKVKKINFWYQIAAAAVILISISTVSYLFLLPNSKNQIAKTQILKNDITAPATCKATITLADGSLVNLDSAANGTLATQGSVKLEKNSNGEIVYSGTAGELVYNTLTNPRGSKAITLTLSDGSQVWLNAESSLKYPTSFSGNERKVEITGEAYFEVAHNSAMPFKVIKGTTEATVLGTHFNVKAYLDDDDVKVTLFEGAVVVSLDSRKQVLRPGEQAIVGKEDIKLVKDADTELALAWKNGYTSFRGAGIKTVLKEIGRWYDITIDIKGELPNYSFYADVKRTAPLMDVLHVLEDSKVKYLYDVQNRKLTVLP